MTSAGTGAASSGTGDSKQQKLQSPDGSVQQSQPQQRQQQQSQIVSSNSINKIPDSDVLIPTSNLQKFIESADKILKNISIQHQVVATVDTTINKCKFISSFLPLYVLCSMLDRTDYIIL